MEAQKISCVIGDDHAVVRKGLVEYLRAEADIQVLGEAADGAEALALAERRAPDVLVLDVHMARVTGVEVCREVVARGLPTKVVLYTGYDDVELLDEALEAGAAGFVVKSGPPADVARALRFAMAGQIYVDASLAGALVRRRAAPVRRLLSQREEEVLGLLADGCTTDEAAGRLFLSPATVRTYAESAMHKVEARNRAHLVAKSLRMGLLV
jgi:DNA-binding NarL/FixJ family response regulator